MILVLACRVSLRGTPCVVGAPGPGQGSVGGTETSVVSKGIVLANHVFIQVYLESIAAVGRRVVPWDILGTYCRLAPPPSSQRSTSLGRCLRPSHVSSETKAKGPGVLPCVVSKTSSSASPSYLPRFPFLT